MRPPLTASISASISVGSVELGAKIFLHRRWLRFYAARHSEARASGPFCPLSGLTWVIWRYDWPFQKGRRTFTVRCYDGDGAPQIVEYAPPGPSCASGLHSKRVMF